MRKQFLMCKPTFYRVDYSINPYMEQNVGMVDHQLAQQQWSNLHGIISDLADVVLIEQSPNLPDMVFTANAGLIFHDLNYVWLSKFAMSERQGEERLFAGWFMAYGFDVIEQPPEQYHYFEGAGDALVDINNEYWLGYGIRTSYESVCAIEQFFDNRKFHILRLNDPRFFHLDTCFAPLSKGHIMWYPYAFEGPAHWYVAMRNGRSSGVALPDDVQAPPDMLIDISEEDAVQFACNVVNIDDVVIMPKCSDELVGRVTDLGYQVITVDLSEFIKAGGAAKCLTLQVR